jgi:hypothetical protein
MKRKHLAISIACGLLIQSISTFAQGSLDLYGEYIYFKRTEVDKIQLVESKTASDNTQLIEDKPDRTTALSNERKFNWKPGYRVGLIYTANCTNSLEINYLHINPWCFERLISGSQDLLIPLRGNVVDFPVADIVMEKYRLAFCAGEANYWYYLTPRAQNYFSFAALFGFHYFRFEEKLQLTSIANTIVNPYFIHMRNDMFGMQLGCLLQTNPTDVTYWNLTAKAGGIANNLRLERSLQGKKEQIKPGFFAEVGAQVGWTPARWVKFYLGYQMLFLYGIGTAPKQLDQKPRHIHHDSRTIFQGISGGITFTF